MPPIVLAALLLSVCAGALASQKLVVRPCDRPLFQAKLRLCLRSFNSSMSLTQYDSSCVWSQAKGSYHALMLCVEDWAQALWCSGVGSDADRFFLDVHRTYFAECGRVRDPPLSALVLMVAPLVVSTLMLPLLCLHLTTRGHH